MWQGQQPYQQPTQPVQPGAGGGGGRRTAVVAVVAATAVVTAAGVTGFLLLGGGTKDGARPSPSPPGAASALPSGSPRGGAEPQPVIPGWKVVVNPKRGIAFDVPPEWHRKSVDWASYVADDRDPEDKPLIGFSAPAMLKEQWCSSDEDRDGTPEDTALAAAGSRGEDGARTTEEAARSSVELWVYGAYTQPDRAKVETGAVEPYTTASGLGGSVATATGTASGTGKCDTDGKATAFAFKNAEGDIVSWTFLGATGVREEVPDATVRRILGTVRLM
ncbi:hypothetical protein [Streptomyces sp. CB03238]|uniref:hypothetical protein n=1 Tax=Streptomyces sp. CB03238 TaxID=1907777 RepID=UPI000A10B846|nr:hypothetical protein [Streptomyces sp. CB03238]ORT59943.1 hypothetical protein BKD26_10060 [Streptomyces sp. CB03238]